MTSQAQPKGTVLVVDDDDAVRSGLYWALASDYQVLQASSRAEACDHINDEEVQVVVSDLHLPPNVDDIAEGLALIDIARAQDPPLQVVVITGSDSKRAALEAVKRGAYGFFEKPLDPGELLHIVNQAVRMRDLEIENRRLRDELSRPPGFAHLMGSSPALERVLQQARSVAQTSATVVLRGENGTGKEMLARAIHQERPRGTGPFVAVSCAALPEALIESELYGHEKGAFTSATQMHKGRFELADGGTLFLDEIGDLSTAVQVKLLRVLQEREFERVGGTKTLTVDIRLIAATNRDLEKEVVQSRFRQDLFFRLNVVPLVLPPLRERHDDIPILAAHFAAKSAQKYAQPTPELEPALVEVLLDYHWPGNVRELENLVERAVILCEGDILSIDERWLHPGPPVPSGEFKSLDELEAHSQEVEKRFFQNILQNCAGRIYGPNGAAQALNVKPTTLQSRLKKLGL